MKLKNLKSVGHNTAHSYLSTLGHIGDVSASTYLHRLALKSGLSVIELDVLSATAPAFLRDEKLAKSLQELQLQFADLLRKDGIPIEAVKSYKLFVERIGNRTDVVDIQCKPVVADWNDKLYECAIIWQKYPEPV